VARKKKFVESEVTEMVEAEQPIEALPTNPLSVRRAFQRGGKIAGAVFINSTPVPFTKKPVELMQEKGAPAALPRPTGPTCSGCPSLQVKSRDKTFNCLHKGAHPIRGGKNQIPHKFAHGYLQRPAWCPFLK